MSEDKPQKSILDMQGTDPDFTGGLRPEEFLRRRRAGEETNPQPSPPTDRPDVEELKAYYQRPDDRTVDLNVVAVCDSYLELEKRLKARLDKEIDEQDRRAEILELHEKLKAAEEEGRVNAASIINVVALRERDKEQFDKADSLLADLVEAVKKYKLGDELSFSEVQAALTAAKQYRESGEEGKP